MILVGSGHLWPVPSVPTAGNDSPPVATTMLSHTPHQPVAAKSHLWPVPSVPTAGNDSPPVATTSRSAEMADPSAHLHRPFMRGVRELALGGNNQRWCVKAVGKNC
jgi:hypothetical protein